MVVNSLLLLQHKPLFYYKNGSYKSWWYLKENYTTVLKSALEDFSPWDDETLSSSPSEFFDETFMSYFWDANHRNKIKSVAPEVFYATKKILSYVD